MGPTIDPRWSPFENHDVIYMLCDVIRTFCGPQRKRSWTYYGPPKSRCHSFKGVGHLVPSFPRPNTRPKNSKKKKAQAKQSSAL